MAVAFEVEHGVYEMFEDFWASKVAVFVHMANEKNADVLRFGELH